MSYPFIQPYSTYNRFITREISLGDIRLGGNNPVRIQTMTNTPTLDIKSTVAQIIKTARAGAEIVRLTVPGIKEAEVLLQIKNELRSLGINTPLVADVHYSPKVAERAARIFEKVRINPGNYADISKSSKKLDFSNSEFEGEKENIQKRLIPLLNICKEYGTAIRIGINHGSLSWRIVGKYGNTPEGMVASAMEFIEVCRAESFHNFVVSMKASNPLTMIHANRLLVQKMSKANMNYPIHLGVTEAGLGENGRIKSAIGIGTLLTEGIGDTVRVSLTEAPEKEIPVAKAIIKETNRIISDSGSNNDLVWPYDPFHFNRRKSQKVEQLGDNQPPVLICTDNAITLNFPDISDSSSPLLNQVITLNADENIYKNRQHISTLDKTLSTAPIFLKFIVNNLPEEDLLYKFSIVAGGLFADGRLDGLWLTGVTNSVQDKVISMAYSVLQASRARITKTEYISCPSCGRTRFNIEKATCDVMEATKQFKGLKIAVMGCVVNGPGEMADADYGYVGAGEGNVNIYKGQQLVLTNVKEDEAVNKLVEIITSK
jgi:(E)-4-hydroxy-3-methylbut-2-enyl-diphosphate synthase